jgi:NitT/TauT family transport system permease protein
MNVRKPESRLPLPRWGGLAGGLGWGRSSEAGRSRPRRSLGADAAVAAGLFGLFYLILTLATAGPGRTAAAQVSLRFSMLPLYALYSLARMAAAYALSLVFSLVYAYVAANSRRAERVLIPILDILQSVPILSFLPSVVLAFIALFPHSRIGVEIAAIILVFTSQAWNMTFSFYHSLITIPAEFQEVARLYRLSRWQRFRQLELPFATVGLVWNSMMSWAGGWFFLMAAEMFTLGSRSFQLPGLGSYLQVAANRGDGRAEAAGLATLIGVIVAMDQLVWRPLIAWADRFKVELTENQTPPRSAVLVLLRRSLLVEWLGVHVFAPAVEAVDRLLARPPRPAPAARPGRLAQGVNGLLLALVGAAAADAVWRGAHLLARVPPPAWAELPVATLLTAARVAASLVLSLWTIPVGVWIGLNRTWAARLQPVAQILASIPATALFPVIVNWLLAVGGGLSYVSVVLMLMGTQWYVLFNVIAGAMSIPEDLKEATELFRLRGWERWRTLILPAIFPFLVTGLITAAGGAWNAAIVTEYVQAGGHTVWTLGLGALIAQSSQEAEYGLLLASTLCLCAVVVLANRLFWRRLYRLAETRFTLGA